MTAVVRHRLSPESFALLSRGDASPGLANHFWITEESRRLLLVSTLIDEIGKQPGVLGPLAPVDGVLEVLATAQRTAPDAVRGLLMNPGVGSGCAYALRRLRGGARSTAPLFLDLGVVHALALAAAARAGLTWSTRLPLRDGHLMLHTYGLVHFPASAAGAMVQASAEAGRLRFHDGDRHLLVPADGSDSVHRGGEPEWWGLRRVEVGDEPRLSVWLDDLDPLRDLGAPIPPARLDPESFARWQRLLADAWALLCRDYPVDAEVMAGGITAIVPLDPLPGWDTRSASNGEAFGGVMVSEPPDAAVMAVSLIHEFQHIKLGALLHLIGLTEPDDGTLYYAPWRDDPRPLAGLLQGIYAFFGIARFWRTRLEKVHGRDRKIAAFEYAYALRQTAESVQIGLAATGLTPAGRELLEGLRDQVDEWQATPTATVEAGIDRLARITADSHRIGWRLRHFRPRAAEVAALAASLADRDPAAPGEVEPALLSPHPGLRWRQRIPNAARRRAVDDGAPQTGDADPITVGENALLANDPAAAREAFAAALSRPGPPAPAHVSDDEARAWAGLAMSLDAEGDRPAAEVLSRRPDLVRALHAARPSHPPAELARWLAPALTSVFH